MFRFFRATAFLDHDIQHWYLVATHTGGATRVVQWCDEGLSQVPSRNYFQVDQQFHFDDGRVLAMTGLPHPEDLLHYERLRHFGLVLRRPNDVFWALVANGGTWLTLVRDSFAWLYEQIRGLTSLPDPSLSPETWHSLIWDTCHNGGRELSNEHLHMLQDNGKFKLM